jgi:hypothetical protein
VEWLNKCKSTALDIHNILKIINKYLLSFTKAASVVVKHWVMGSGTSVNDGCSEVGCDAESELQTETPPSPSSCGTISHKSPSSIPGHLAVSLLLVLPLKLIRRGRQGWARNHPTLSATAVATSFFLVACICCASVRYTRESLPLHPPIRRIFSFNQNK